MTDTADKITQADRAGWIEMDCPICGAPKGERCKDTLGKPHPDEHKERMVWSTFVTRPPISSPVAGEIAKIIDPHCFSDEGMEDGLVSQIVTQSREDALRKADRILTALQAQPAVGDVIPLSGFELDEKHLPAARLIADRVCADQDDFDKNDAEDVQRWMDARNAAWAAFHSAELESQGQRAASLDEAAGPAEIQSTIEALAKRADTKIIERCAEEGRAAIVTLALTSDPKRLVPADYSSAAYKAIRALSKETEG